MASGRKKSTTAVPDTAKSLAAIKRECQALLASDAAMFVNFAIRTLMEARTCETQLPSIDPPAHVTGVE